MEEISSKDGTIHVGECNNLLSSDSGQTRVWHRILSLRKGLNCDFLLDATASRVSDTQEVVVYFWWDPGRSRDTQLLCIPHQDDSEQELLPPQTSVSHS
ncbi:hypothetical protein CDAR_419011 [Caerostris darwini]|uniref:Uncharacterized protein n=1 Tax=Caerostris darwini TaxID=1538125 RepID=A0AAV4MVP9_9ARAC|nr:hypothetical protein CDAR_419011 [Caerostris darwini]